MAAQPVPLNKASRLFNRGPTLLVDSAHGERINVTAAARKMPLYFDPPKVAVVIDKATLTRELIDASGVLSVGVPSVAQAWLTQGVGGESGKDHPDKLQRCCVLVDPGLEAGCPPVQGAIAFKECRIPPATAHVAGQHYLILAEAVRSGVCQRVLAFRGCS
jgi:flavin reductase (DIM6/NTAB) family NADH-FMN oxidoreductase RutF